MTVMGKSALLLVLIALPSSYSEQGAGCSVTSCRAQVAALSDVAKHIRCYTDAVAKLAEATIQKASSAGWAGDPHSVDLLTMQSTPRLPEPLPLSLLSATNGILSSGLDCSAPIDGEPGGGLYAALSAGLTASVGMVKASLAGLSTLPGIDGKTKADSFETVAKLKIVGCLADWTSMGLNFEEAITGALSTDTMKAASEVTAKKLVGEELARKEAECARVGMRVQQLTKQLETATPEQRATGGLGDALQQAEADHRECEQVLRASRASANVEATEVAEIVAAKQEGARELLELLVAPETGWMEILENDIECVEGAVQRVQMACGQ